ncbi:hypothetical protein TcYC6_0025020 [Trypanosoma cruzi]|uniref:Uncharacterized protein n=1 Tax=Trypanosoma cruzi (strain CL Brener) TaxID=353153 RepID=Q4DR68_TRYCC|nr:hypothetical protein Tc00.1047053504033.160 [Trypanosoma cruzi]EAN95021.1 hypothetical protein Tc00.1047053504033.160 [Trypanosoma cruzi]KAF8289441.1 hypothetical protein TcYC6_0025020 [Trypanosoma cruzi]RNC54969.1 hypothetical protein TcCL_ESM07572 [Trypanosoma cruzi]|eukprot:XP_816872.1 hypothetical protein [Trypanosoma cruzi strain CL Brener]
MLPPPLPLPAKEASPPPPFSVKQEPPTPLVAALEKPSECVVPGVFSAVDLDGNSICECSPLKASGLTAMGSNECTAGGMTFLSHEGGSDGEQHPIRERSGASLPHDQGDGCTSRSGAGETPNSPFIIREKLLRLLRGIASSGSEASYGATNPDVAVSGNGNDIPSCYCEEHVILDDLFIHLLLALEKVVHEFLCRSLAKEWKSKRSKEASPRSSSEKETARLWTRAWRQAQYRDEEAWIEWRSALCRSWRRTRRESASQERSEALNIALFQFDPLGGALARSAPSLSCHGIEKQQTEKGASSQKLYALLYRVFFTCPALLLDGHTQRLAAAAGLDLNSVRQHICVTEDVDCDYDGDGVASFMRNLSCPKQVRVDKADLTAIDEVERLFASDRRALLSRIDLGQSPPLLSSPFTASFPMQPAGSPHSPRIPSLHARTPKTRSSAASVPQYIEPTPIQLRPPSFAPLDRFSPAARIPDEVGRQFAGQLASPSNYEQAVCMSDNQPDTLEARKVKQKNGSEGRRAFWHADGRRYVSTSLPSQPRVLDGAQSERRLPSALRTPRSVSIW